MEPSRRNQIVLAMLVIALAGLIYYEWPSTPATTGSAANVSRENRQPVTPAQATTLNVHLDALEAARPQPGAGDRNLFRFRPKEAPPRAAGPAPPPPVAVTPAAPAAPAPPSLPPIALKFIGIVEAPERGQKIAVLSDQYGVYYGREGEAVLGQFKILRIGAESIDMAYLDGRGRQTIRLSGS